MGDVAIVAMSVCATLSAFIWAFAYAFKQFTKYEALKHIELEKSKEDIGWNVSKGVKNG